ncbi:DUF2254 domain-containing protein [Falsirhodobacter halotolerans]|uniref:DUF2254 domain-containing protein n=1 Tax=Falsirhodobacter halotolerans TaxID=1146892 RepID=UPI001FD15E47|nr:DUF2254 domain-containing protein [Falsirhodobacter halotolerans]MCJ8141119.1 DUF2254 domain-containing protein [Falsirhodobacter halotolerans]
MSRWQWIWSRITRRLWLRATLIGLLGVATAILAAVVERFIPWQLPGAIAANSVDNLLNIIASSMLAVTTFSLSVATSAYGSATTNVTPRATRLLMEDRLTQNVLSTFVGSFLFAIVGIIMLTTGAYGDRGRLVLFAATIGVVALIVVTLLRWIDHLTRLGRVGDTNQRVEDATRRAIVGRQTAPWLGGHPLPDGAPALPHAITGRKIGYLQHIDMAHLSDWAEDKGARVHVARIPGAFIFPHTVLARTDIAPDEDDDLAAAFTIEAERSYDQDPRFGLVVMAEIASRALSPAVNDPGTAIDIIGRCSRLLALWGEDPTADEIAHPAVFVPPITDDDMLADAFGPIARDGAAVIEVQLRLQKTLAALSVMGRPTFSAAAARQSDLALSRALAAMEFAPDQARVTAAASAVAPGRPLGS